MLQQLSSNNNNNKKKYNNEMMSRITQLDLQYLSLGTISEGTLGSLFGCFKSTLAKLTLYPSSSQYEYLPRLLEHITGINFPNLSSLKLVFVRGITEVNKVLAFLETILAKQTLTKLSIVSSQTEHNFDGAMPRNHEATKLFERIFGIIAAKQQDNRIQSLSIAGLHVGCLDTFLRGLSMIKGLKRLNLYSFNNYTYDWIDRFNSGFTEYLKSSTSKSITRLSTPLPVCDTIVSTITNMRGITRLRMMPLGIPIYPDTLQQVGFTNMVSNNYLTRLDLDIHHYLTEDNVDSFTEMLRASKSLCHLNLGDVKHLHRKQLKKLMASLVGQTNIQTLHYSNSSILDFDYSQYGSNVEFDNYYTNDNDHLAIGGLFSGHSINYINQYTLYFHKVDL
ncbi:hypothetical protein SAMD00019534_030470 [Acytostelium subglobosum LB1]|uniref:hypothetical protein n=1 Tax=Acytostelium subglobosum LB1 TaxID=1410327 RepID=UPI0006448CF3|nr:hypothetical protein SAMD00019534_030470 [Acytostelium subglobosum LB1]GAM19872.1 hypothetical protein SAMD00019534_030470 [Acytostelium subglobosum LB1]|eukprot:XP_012756634.1 hypothetical protein SAMD00019534_030470 [Acytostelium subglobosum LB1]